MKRIIIFSAAILTIYMVATLILNLPQKKAEISQTTFNNPQITGAVTPSANLKSEDIKIGDGAEAKSGQSVTVNYLGTLTDGKKFDSSYDRKEPFTFTLGAGEVIKGWDQGVVGMKIGGKRRLAIPAELAYGDQAQGAIPANSTLIFEIELMSVGEKANQKITQPNLNL
jgi:FKBP-type peptidyl-prolyl cis-trans isomerase